jgi:anti-sigma factor RsiW
MIGCNEARRMLDDYVDGALSQETVARFEAHLAACPTCRGALERTQEVIERARALPRSIEPGRDLWPGVASRIGRGTVVPLRRGPGRWAVLAGMAAAVVFGATVVLLSGPSGRRHVATAREAAAPGVRAAALEGQDFASERDLERAASDLREALRQRRDRLTPETARVIDENLDIIDAAIARMKRALDQEPADPELVTLLAETYRRKIDLLETATELSQKS